MTQARGLAARTEDTGEFSQEGSPSSSNKDFPPIDILDQGYTGLLLPSSTIYTPNQVGWVLQKWKKTDKRFKTTADVQTFFSIVVMISLETPLAALQGPEKVGTNSQL